MNHKSWRYCAVILLGIIYFKAHPQTPGYMGKRFSAGYGLYASPGYYGSAGTTIINTQHEGFLEFVAKKRFSVGISAKLYNAAYANNRDVKIDNDVSLPAGFTGYRQIDTRPPGTTHIKAVNYSLYGKFFRENFLAPWGKYFMLGITLNTFETSYEPDQMQIQLEATSYSYYNYTSTQNFYFSDFGPAKQSFKKFDIMIGQGRSRIIANRLILDYGYNINLWATTMALFDINDEQTNASLKSSEYINVVSRARIRGINRFNVFLKVGILLF